MESLKNKIFSGERALFFARDLELKECTFADGESPLKHSRNILIYDTTFNWKYPAWYSEDVRIRDSVLNVTARAGIWYTRDVSLIGCDIQAPKTFRRSFGIRIENCTMPNAEETLWWCSDVKIKNVKAKGNYFAMNASRIEAEGLELDGDYCFDGAKEVTVSSSRLMSKDAFWNCSDVTVRDSVICGEYLGWNSKNLTFINCTIESLQGLCFVENLKLINCTLKNTTLAFEYSTVDADIVGSVDSVKNPAGGRICADGYGEIILEADRVDTSATEIVTRGR